MGLRVMTRDTVNDVPNQPKTPQRSFRISDDLYLPLKELAASEGVTASDIVRELIEERLREAGK